LEVFNQFHTHEILFRSWRRKIRRGRERISLKYLKEREKGSVRCKAGGGTQSILQFKKSHVARVADGPMSETCGTGLGDVGDFRKERRAHKKKGILCFLRNSDLRQRGGTLSTMKRPMRRVTHIVAKGKEKITKTIIS